MRNVYCQRSTKLEPACGPHKCNEMQCNACHTRQALSAKQACLSRADALGNLVLAQHWVLLGRILAIEAAAFVGRIQGDAAAGQVAFWIVLAPGVLAVAVLHLAVRRFVALLVRKTHVDGVFVGDF